MVEHHASYHLTLLGHYQCTMRDRAYQTLPADAHLQAYALQVHRSSRLLAHLLHGILDQVWPTLRPYRRFVCRQSLSSVRLPSCWSICRAVRDVRRDMDWYRASSHLEKTPRVSIKQTCRLDTSVSLCHLVACLSSNDISRHYKKQTSWEQRRRYFENCVL